MLFNLIRLSAAISQVEIDHLQNYVLDVASPGMDEMRCQFKRCHFHVRLTELK